MKYLCSMFLASVLVLAACSSGGGSSFVGGGSASSGGATVSGYSAYLAGGFVAAGTVAGDNSRVPVNPIAQQRYNQFVGCLTTHNRQFLNGGNSTQMTRADVTRAKVSGMNCCNEQTDMTMPLPNSEMGRLVSSALRFNHLDPDFTNYVRNTYAFPKEVVVARMRSVMEGQSGPGFTGDALTRATAAIEARSESSFTLAQLEALQLEGTPPSNHPAGSGPYRPNAQHYAHALGLDRLQDICQNTYPVNISQLPDATMRTNVQHVVNQALCTPKTTFLENIANLMLLPQGQSHAVCEQLQAPSHYRHLTSAESSALMGCAMRAMRGGTIPQDLRTRQRLLDDHGARCCQQTGGVVARSLYRFEEGGSTIAMNLPRFPSTTLSCQSGESQQQCQMRHLNNAHRNMARGAACEANPSRCQPSAEQVRQLDSQAREVFGRNMVDACVKVCQSGESCIANS